MNCCRSRRGGRNLFTLKGFDVASRFLTLSGWVLCSVSREHVANVWGWRLALSQDSAELGVVLLGTSSISKFNQKVDC